MLPRITHALVAWTSGRLRADNPHRLRKRERPLLFLLASRLSNGFEDQALRYGLNQSETLKGYGYLPAAEDFVAIGTYWWLGDVVRICHERHQTYVKSRRRT